MALYTQKEVILGANQPIGRQHKIMLGSVLKADWSILNQPISAQEQLGMLSKHYFLDLEGIILVLALEEIRRTFNYNL